MHRRQTLLALGAGCALASLALAGCGGSGSSSTSSSSSSSSQPTASTAAQATTTSSSHTETIPKSKRRPKFDISISTSVATKPIAARYTCDGANTWPTLHWSNVPADTKEIELYLFNVEYVHGKLAAEWGVAGLSPALTGLSTGHLPKGAVVGRNIRRHSAYSFCPPKGREASAAFLLYALPEKVPAAHGFDINSLQERTEHIAKSAGELFISYKRH